MSKGCWVFHSRLQVLARQYAPLRLPNTEAHLPSPPEFQASPVGLCQCGMSPPIIGIQIEGFLEIGICFGEIVGRKPAIVLPAFQKRIVCHDVWLYSEFPTAEYAKYQAGYAFYPDFK